jgi:hypothetical protein
MADHMTVADLLPESLQLGPAMAQGEAEGESGGSLIPWDLVARPAEDALRGLLQPNIRPRRRSSSASQITNSRAIFIRRSACRWQAARRSGRASR